MRDMGNRQLLEFLFARLLWPVPLVRLRTAQEIAALVKEEPTREETVDFFIDYLGNCELESECSALLQIVDAWDLHSFFDQRDLGIAIKAHSLETFRVLGEWPYGEEVALSFQGLHSGSVGHDFEPSKLFEENHSTGIPPVFRHELQKMDQKYGLPFFSQWAFEWEELQNKHQFSYVGTVSYFLDHDWQSRQAQLDVMQHELLISAYLRTLSCAVDEWGMPLDFAGFQAAFTLRINKQLADIEPETISTNYLELEEHCKNLSLKKIAEYCVENMFVKEEEYLTTEFSVPILTGSADRKLRVKGKTFIGKCEDLNLSDNDVEDILNKTHAVTCSDPAWMHGLLDEEKIENHSYTSDTCYLLPICLTSFPIHNGRWLQDYFSNGFKFPTSYLFEGTQLSFEKDGKGLAFIVNGEVVGQWGCWNRGWTQSYIQQGRSNIGSETSISNRVVEDFCNQNNLERYYIITIEEWSRDQSYGDYEHQMKHFILQRRAIS